MKTIKGKDIKKEKKRGKEREGEEKRKISERRNERRVEAAKSAETVFLFLPSSPVSQVLKLIGGCCATWGGEGGRGGMEFNFLSFLSFSVGPFLSSSSRGCSRRQSWERKRGRGINQFGRGDNFVSAPFLRAPSSFGHFVAFSKWAAMRNKAKEAVKIHARHHFIHFDKTCLLH